MKALSINQPWAALIVYGIPILKDVPVGDGMVRLEDAVHASKKHDREAMDWLLHSRLVPPMWALMLESPQLPHGSLIGEVDLIDCVTSHPSPWFVGVYGFVLAKPAPYKAPIPYRGQLGFFDVTLPVAA